MKIGIISDTHDDLENTKKAIRLFNQELVDCVFHAGDYIFPVIISLFENLNKNTIFYGVRGNNDGELIGIKEKFNRLDNAVFMNDFGKIKINEKKIGIYHGTNQLLTDTLIESQLFDILIFGHTHIKRNEKRGNTIVLNPGPLNGSFFPIECTDNNNSNYPSIIIHDLDKELTEFISITQI